MTTAPFGLDPESCMSIYEIMSDRKMRLLHVFDEKHARFEDILTRDCPDVQDWITTARIGRLLAHVNGTSEDVIAHGTLPGMFNQLPTEFQLELREWQGSDGSSLCIAIYRPTSSEHALINHGLQAGYGQVLTKAQNIDHAAREGVEAGNRLSACTALLTQLQVILQEPSDASVQ